MSALEDNDVSCDTIPYHTVLQLENMTTESRYVDGTLKFFPPMYIQRYEAVSLLLKRLPWNENIKKVIDFGCSELGFFLHLKYIPSIAEILEVDVDEEVLVRYATRAAPLNSDYLFSKRNKPLNVYLLAGSIGDYDDQLQGADVVVAIEVLEHLNKEVLDQVPRNIFHDIKPKVAIFTTPNADFNVLFTNMGAFRHPDHKFEWTRMEFIKWSQEVVNKYTDYTVKLYGIGVGPEDTEAFGCCTQIAVFERKPECEGEFDSIRLKRGINNYKLVREYIYPYYVDRRPRELKIFHEVEYRLKFTFHVSKFFNTEDELFEIPLSEILPYVSEWCESEEALRAVLTSQGFYVLDRDGMIYLSYRGYMSDSEGEEIESVEMNPPVELTVRENFDVENAGASTSGDPRKIGEMTETWPDNSGEGAHCMESTAMEPQYDEAVGYSGVKNLNPSDNLLFTSSDSTMMVDQEPEVNPAVMNWSAVSKAKEPGSENGKLVDTQEEQYSRPERSVEGSSLPYKWDGNPLY